jgi:hypothetical protein
MVSSAAKTVKDYLSGLPAERRREIARVRSEIRANLPAGYKEMMQFGMIAYCVKLSRYPETYNGAPLLYAALAAQKSHNAIYLMGIYADADLRTWFETGYKASGKKLDAGKSCVRFKTLDDLPLKLVGEAIAKMPPERFIALYERARGVRAGDSKSRKPSSRRPKGRSRSRC